MPGNVQSIERAAAILRVLASGDGPRPLGELADLLDLRKSTAHGIVRTLISVGFVRQDRASGDYVLSDELAPIAPLPMDLNELRARAMNWVDALAAKTGMSARLVVFPRTPAEHVTSGEIVQHVFSSTRESQHVEVGEQLPLTSTAEGKVLLALEPRGLRLLRSIPVVSSTHWSLTDLSQVRAELDVVRRARYATDYEEFSVGRGGVAAPVTGSGGAVLAALGVRGPVGKVFTASREVRTTVLSRLREAAHGTSRAIVAERW